MVEPGDKETEDRSRLRASHADREQVIDVLKTAFVQGRLTRDEFGLRVGQALASRTYADLAALTADLPAGTAAIQPLPATPLAERAAPDAEPARRPGRVLASGTIARVSASGAAASMAFTAAVVGESVNVPVAIALAAAAATGLFVAGLLVALLAFLSWAVQRRSRRASASQPPSADGHPVARRSPAGGLPPAGRDSRHTTQAAQARRPRPALARP